MLVTLNLIRYKKNCVKCKAMYRALSNLSYTCMYTHEIKKKMFQMDDDLQKEIELRDYSLNFAKRVS